ncbi:MAG: SDR family oxidoreductase [Chitinophagales bacterium]|nr:SDR family oxidoreductase [Chitinophagales bacterium]MDW8419053.1 SDR family oxidoreductase [Chitinophagales bacterium]
MFDKVLSGKIALVTGGGSGIGFAIAKQMLTQGAKVIIASRKQERLSAAAAKLSAYGEVRYHVCDTREPEQVERLMQSISETEKNLHILVNNAGGQFPSPAEDISIKGWNVVINNNLNGTFYVTQTAAKHFFIPQRGGKVINIIANIYRGFPGMAHTGAARAGVDNLTKSLAVEWSKYHIQVNAIAPGIIRSTGLEQYPPELLRGIEETIPAKRLGTPDEVAYLALFLASHLADYITGETIYVDGGQRLWGDVWKM